MATSPAGLDTFQSFGLYKQLGYLMGVITGAVRAAVCLSEALDAVLEELPNARSLLATRPVSLP